MQSLMIVVLGIAGMSFGWFVYSKFIATKSDQRDEIFGTPAHEFSDGGTPSGSRSCSRGCCRMIRGGPSEALHLRAVFA